MGDRESIEDYVDSLEDSLRGVKSFRPLLKEVQPWLASHLRAWLSASLTNAGEVRLEMYALHHVERAVSPPDWIRRLTDDQLTELLHQYIQVYVKREMSGQTHMGGFWSSLREIDLIFDRCAFYLKVTRKGLAYRVDPSLVEGVERAHHEAAQVYPDASLKLADAWVAAYSLTGDPSAAVQACINAVEAVMIPKVLPDRPRAIYGHAVKELQRTAEEWRLEVVTDKGEDDIEPLIAMLNRLGQAHTDRHAGSGSRPPVTVKSARSCVQLAATLVQWFASDTVVRR